MNPYSVLTNEGRNVLLYWNADGDPVMVTETNPNYLAISQALANGEDPDDIEDEDAIDWFGDTYLDDEAFEDDPFDIGLDDDEVAVVVESLSEVIERYKRNGMDASNLVRFMGRLSSNPSYSSREQLFTWSQAKSLTVDADGYLIGYKGVDDDLCSSFAGTAIVDGVQITGKIPYAVGSVVEMPRHLVNDNPNEGCSTGLHVGSWDYASGWGSRTIEVRIDPADVVSVPADCGFQKMRVCRLTVVAIHGTDDGDLTDYEPEANWDDEAVTDLMGNPPKGFLAALKRTLRLGGKDKS